jgi:LPS-assembly lipoprotein
MKRLGIILTISVAIALLQGCGFHLRGQVKLSSQISPLYVESSDPELAKQLEEALSASGNDAVESKGGAAAVLRLFDVRYERVIRTVDTRGKATGYVLSYATRFNVQNKAGEMLFNTRNVALQRDYNFDPTQVLAKEQEETYLRRDMQRDVAQQILRQLATISR